MDLLKERIMQEGRCFPGGILKVDSFVNHQMDPILMMDLAKEFVRLFKDIKYNKIITIEASGIAPAIMVGYLTNLPVVFVKKKQPKMRSVPRKTFCTLPASITPRRSFQKRLPMLRPPMKLGAGREWLFS